MRRSEKFMHTFNPAGIERILWFSTRGQSHLLVKAKGRGWFIDTRNVAVTKPPSKKAILACLTDPIESGFIPCKAKEWKKL